MYGFECALLGLKEDGGIRIFHGEKQIAVRVLDNALPPC